MADIRYRDNDLKLATEVVNKLIDTYIDFDLRSKFDRITARVGLAAEAAR